MKGKERSNFPSPIAFATPRQLEGSIKALENIHGEKFPAVVKLKAKREKSKKSYRKWLERNDRMGALPKREHLVIVRLREK